MQWALDKLHPKDNFNIILYDHRRVFFESTKNFAIASDTNKETALDWLYSYRPDKGTSEVIHALDDAFMLSNITGESSFNTLIFMSHSKQFNETKFTIDLTKKYEKEIKYQNIRLWCIGIGPYVNCHFLEYISRLGRGKFIQLLNRNTLVDDIIDFLNEFRVPLSYLNCTCIYIIIYHKC